MSTSFEKLTDNQVIKQLAKSPTNRQLFAEFYTRFHRLICYVILEAINYYTLHDVALDEDDMIQQFYTRLFDPQEKLLETFQGKSENSATTWLTAVAKYMVINIATRKYPFTPLFTDNDKNLSEVTGSLQAVEKDLTSEDINRIIDQCLRKIANQYKDPELRRLIFKLWLDEIEAKNICEWLSRDISVKTVQNIITLMKDDMRSCLQPQI